jgi:hypothetical protein
MAGLTTTLAIMTVGAAGAQAIHARKQAKGIERMGDYEQSRAELNAQLAEQQAEDVLVLGREAAQRHGINVRQFLGSQRARLAAQGIEIGEGSAADVLGETMYFGEMDRLTILNNAARQAYGYRLSATDLRHGGALASLSARTQAASLRNQGWNSLLTGAANVFSLYGSRSAGGGDGYAVPSRRIFEDAMRRAGY